MEEPKDEGGALSSVEEAEEVEETTEDTRVEIAGRLKAIYDIAINDENLSVRLCAKVIEIAADLIALSEDEDDALIKLDLLSSLFV